MIEPVACTNYAGDDGPWLIDPDPDWPGTPSKPPGRGWIWVASAADILRRFGNLGRLPETGVPIWCVEPVDIEVYAAANPEHHYPAVHERLYSYGLHSSLGWLGPMGRTDGWGYSGYDIEGRGGAWVRRIEPMPEAEEADDAAC